MSMLSTVTNDCYHGLDKQPQAIPPSQRHIKLDRLCGTVIVRSAVVRAKNDLRQRGLTSGLFGKVSSACSMSSISGHIRLGDATYQVEAERIITSSGDEILLRSQSALVLRLLAARLGKLVTREHLIAEIWPDVAVTDDSLTQCISDIRRALGDTKRTILKTAPKRGYILYGEVATSADPGLNSILPDIAMLDAPPGTMALAVRDTSETLQELVNHLPVFSRPSSSSIAESGARILFFENSTDGLQAALCLAKATDAPIAVEFTRGQGKGAEALVAFAKRGEVLASQDVVERTNPGVGCIFHDLGLLETSSSLDAQHAFRVMGANTRQIITPQLDPRDVLPTLAILPLRSQIQGPRGGLSTFLSDEIARAVSRSEDMNVISRLSTVAITQDGGSLRDIGRLLNADFILSGNVLEQDNKAILLIEFAETDSQFVLWSDRIAFPIDALLRENEGIDQIVTHVRRAIMLNEIRRVRSAPLQDLKLFSVLHGAVGLMHRFSPKDFNLAYSYLEYVVSKAPNHPTPLAWLARWHVLRTVQGWADNPQIEAQQALNFTGRALDLDPDHTLALVCEGQVLAHLARRLDEAKLRYDAALGLNPNDAQGRALRGMLSSFRDHGADGKRDAERALHLSPLDPHRFFFLALASAANIAAGDDERAVVLAKESLRLNRTHVSTLRTLAVAQVGAGQEADARETAAEIRRLQPDLRVSTWLKNSPGADYEMGRASAEKLRSIGIPD